MIEDITFKNILSFKDEVTFSFEATDDTTIESSHVVVMPNGTRLLKFGVVYGANASGKSNLLYVIEWLRRFWISDPQNLDNPTIFEPFLLDANTPKLPTEYSMKFWVKGVRYWYQLKVNGKQIIYEKLSYYKTVQPIKIFERYLEDGVSVVTFNPAVQRLSKDAQNALNLNSLPNKSFFAVRGHVNISMKYVDDVREWIHTMFMPMIDPVTKMTRYGEDKIIENADFKDYLVNFLNLADFNITGLVSHSDKGGTIGFEHTVENSRGVEKYELSLVQQSAGTKRVIGIEAAVFEAIKGGCFLMIDEMESSLHPKIMEYIIQEFLLKSNDSQLLITTHYQGLLNTIGDLIRKDNIWFVEKNKSGSTDLFSLVEFNGVNKITNMVKAYRNGQFGALPSIKD